jgi:hypothetical protein
MLTCTCSTPASRGRRACFSRMSTALVLSFTLNPSSRANSMISKQSRRSSGSPPLMVRKNVFRRPRIASETRELRRWSTRCRRKFQVAVFAALVATIGDVKLNVQRHAKGQRFVVYSFHQAHGRFTVPVLGLSVSHRATKCHERPIRRQIAPRHAALRPAALQTPGKHAPRQFSRAASGHRPQARSG